MSQTIPIACPPDLQGPGSPIRVLGIQRGDGMVVIDLAGEIRLDCSERLYPCILKCQEESSASAVVLDFGRIQFVDSQGLALLFMLFKALRERQCTLAVRHASPHVSSLLEMTRLVDYIQLIP